MDGGDPSGYTTTGGATYDIETDIAAMLVEENTKLSAFVAIVGTPTKSQHTLEGYYFDPEFIFEMKTTDVFDVNTTLYLKWEAT